jgi:hypothetical protein
MAMIGARIAALGLALAVFCPSPQACAFGLRLGPFLFGVRAHHHHHYRHVVRRPTEALRRPTEAVRKPTEGLHPKATPTDDVAQNRAPSLLYPILAWPSFADDIFWPTDHSSWPFSYQSIFDQAFAESTVLGGSGYGTVFEITGNEYEGRLRLLLALKAPQGW